MMPEKEIKRMNEITNEIPKLFNPIGGLIKQGKTVKALENALKIIKLQNEYQKIQSYLLIDIQKRLSNEEERIANFERRINREVKE